MEVNTQFGTVALEELIRVYEMHRNTNLRHQTRRLNFLQTEEGKEYNRTRAANYYERNREQILEKRKQKYRERTGRQVQRVDANTQTEPLDLEHDVDEIF